MMHNHMAFNGLFLQLLMSELCVAFGLGTQTHIGLGKTDFQVTLWVQGRYQWFEACGQVAKWSTRKTFWELLMN